MPRAIMDGLQLIARSGRALVWIPGAASIIGARAGRDPLDSRRRLS